MPSEVLTVSAVGGGILAAVVVSILVFLYKRRRRKSTITGESAGRRCEPQYNNTAGKQITHSMPVAPKIETIPVQPPQELLPLSDALLDKTQKRKTRLGGRARREKMNWNTAGKQNFQESSTDKRSAGIYAPVVIPFTSVLTNPAGHLTASTERNMKRLSGSSFKSASSSSDCVNGSNADEVSLSRRSVSLSSNASADSASYCKGDTSDDSEFEVVMDNPHTAETMRYGVMEFIVTFHKSENQLEFQLLNITNLPIQKNEREPNPIAKVYFIHGDGKFRCEFAYTKQLRGTRNPMFNETVTFEVHSSKVLSTGLIRVKVLDKESITSLANLGEIRVDLSDNPDVLNGEKHLWSMQPKLDFRGDLQVSVCHQATSAKLYVRVIRARFLQKVTHRNPKGYFVIIEFRFKDRNVLQKYTTKIKRKSRHPVFNEDVMFDVNTNSAQTLDEFSLVLTVYKQEALKKTTLVGHVMLGKMSLIPKEALHWKSVTSSPHVVVSHWHNLH